MTEKDESPLTTEQLYFAESEAYYRRHYAGRYVLIHGNTFCGSFTTQEEAYAEGVRRFGNVPMLIRRVALATEKHDYGERQGRADYIMQRLRAAPDKRYVGPQGENYTYAEVADQIECGTEFGLSVVAVAGLVYQAMSATPEFFKRE